MLVKMLLVILLSQPVGEFLGQRLYWFTTIGLKGPISTL